ncbi:MAG TPA: DUF1674 domain-containing protein [Rhodospirillales bacterium]|nr:DUF1674 domain-containing protein [Rhodospirillales bacterium]
MAPVAPEAGQGKTPSARPDAAAVKPREIAGPKGPEPTRYGDWERKGRCVDF